MAGIRPPRLDDRSYEDLRAELRRRIPAHAPEWTDHNPGDPGIALLELFAWLGENLLYRMNRVPEKAELEFLRLLNIPLRSARPAHGLLRCQLPKGASEPVLITQGSGSPATIAEAGTLPYQIREECSVLPCEIQTYRKEWRDQGDVEGLEEFSDFLDDLLNSGGETIPSEHPVPQPYQSVAWEPIEAGVLPQPVSLSRALDRSAWIAVLAPEPLLAGLDDAQRAARLHALRRDLGGSIINLGAFVDEQLCGSEDHYDCASSNVRYPLRWEIATGRFVGDAKRFNRILYQPLDVIEDVSDTFQRSGVVRLRLPATRGSEPGFGTWRAEDFDVPDPDIMGIGELPPRLEDERVNDRVLTWIRVRRRDEDAPQPRLRALIANAVSCEQAEAVGRELLGYGKGRPGQAVTLAKIPVLADSLVVQVRETHGWVNWHRVDSLAESRANDPHYELDPKQGRIIFGDGINGRMPQPGELIRALGYRAGGGEAGNVPAGSITRIRSGPSGVQTLKVENPMAMRGGRDGESVPEAKRRIPQMLRHRDRSVARQDYVDLALETPGVEVGRVEVLPRHQPHVRLDEVPGVVTVIVLPAYDSEHPDEPVPDREMQRRVCEWLEPRRPLTTELYVSPPAYVPLWISVAIQVEDGFGEQTVQQWVALAIRQYLAPLPPYGPDGGGWPFGRDVRSAHIEAAILRVQGVALVTDIIMENAAGELSDSEPLLLQRWQLPVLRNVQVRSGEEADPIDHSKDPDPELGEEPAPYPDGVPVPVEEEVC